ncbi:MAG: S-adenosylmethionine decarboxylase proenzyme [candidate division WS2 bacterium]|uniref:S-adenosylmethionine decarboxylase proenzyme n=1 Tax=Psychracetigena formicireducens TaxID=2986056 RepID=A0A9E2BFP3_PSYF1|nr:S-adenosylmethionine decarboxylase proenzyme [Candidatus Psychracetigena formicireducens]MBT9144755.1 S-adenosylmethionine decarboxylase proenzyme [Candidatus Psychracetigena formicireducens]
MQTVGKHHLIEISECTPRVLDDIEKVKTIMLEAALKAKAEVKKTLNL